MDLSYSAVHSKVSLVRPWEVGVWGGWHHGRVCRKILMLKLLDEEPHINQG